jgi:lipooligosaccharide transport system permease protein
MTTTAAVFRVVEREARVFRRLWRSSVYSSFVTPVLFLAAIGLGLGGLVDERRGDVAGLDYLSFVAPGLLAASAMQTAAGESLWPVMAGTKWVRTFHAMVATPVGAADVYGGFVVWTAVRVSMSATAFLIVAALLGGVPSAWGVLALPAAVLCAAAFAAPLAAFAATQEVDVAFPLILRLGIVPLFLFSGTFFPVDELPDWLRPISALSPLWHGVELCRAATTGSVEWGAAAAHVAILAGCVGAGWVWGTRSFTRRLAQ